MVTAPNTIPPGLAAIVGNRDLATTAELADATRTAPQTIRKNYCQRGECFGIRPVKLPGSSRLLWPVREIAAVLNGEAAK